MPNRTVEDDIQAYNRAKDERSSFDSLYQDVADLTLTSRTFTTKLTPGQQRTTKIFNSTAPYAVQTLAAALDGLGSNASIRWFGIDIEDFDESQDEEVATWLYDCTTKCLDFMASAASGYPLATHENYLDHCAFGTAVMQCVDSMTTGQLRFRARDLASFYVCENDDGELEEFYRYFEPTVKEMHQMFPQGKFSDRVKSLYQNAKTHYTKVPMFHCVYRRYEYDPKRMNALNKPWSSKYYEVDSKTLVHEGGFDRNPYIVSRWSKASGEAYGRSPAIDCLPTIKVINAREKTQLIAGEKAVNPPMYVPANGIEGGVRIAPGSVNYYKPGFAPPTPMNSGVNLPFGRAEIEADQMQIERSFFLDALTLPEINRMTREEVITRRQQGLLRASPILQRLNTEKTGPEIEIVFNYLSRSGQFLPRPRQIMGKKLKIAYRNPLALSRQQSEADNFTAAMTTLAPVGALDPQALANNIDVDSTIRTVWNMHNANPKFLRTRRDADARRRQQEQNQAVAQSVALAQGGADAVRSGAAAVKDLTAASPVV